MILKTCRLAYKAPRTPSESPHEPKVDDTGKPVLDVSNAMTQYPLKSIDGLL
jgi:hypothetical protein